MKAAQASGGGACQAGKVDPAGLRVAENETKDAMLNGSLPPLADVPTKGALVLGRLFACMSIAQVDDRWADAQRQYGKVLDDYQNGDPAAKTRLRNLAAEAHADLALLKMNTAGKDWTGAYREAASEYGQASDLTRRLDRKAVFQLWIGRIHLYLGECAPARQRMDAATGSFQQFRQANPAAARPEHDAFSQEVETQLAAQCP